MSASSTSNHELGAGIRLDDAREGQGDACDDREHGDGEHRPVQPAGEGGAGREQEPEEQERLGEPYVHGGSLREGAASAAPSLRQISAL